MTTKTATPAQPKTQSRIVGFLSGALMACALVGFGAMLGNSHTAKAEATPVPQVHKAVPHRHHKPQVGCKLVHPHTITTVTEQY